MSNERYWLEILNQQVRFLFPNAHTKHHWLQIIKFSVIKCPVQRIFPTNAYAVRRQTRSCLLSSTLRS